MRFGAERATMRAVKLEAIPDRGDLFGHSPNSAPLRSGSQVAANPARSTATPGDLVEIMKAEARDLEIDSQTYGFEVGS